MADVCAAESIRSNDAQLIRLGENAIFLLSHHDLVIRIGRDENVVADSRKEVAVASWLRDAHLPAAETTAHSQPLLVRSHPVTFWKLIDDSGKKPPLAALGEILRRLHALPVPDQR